MAEEKRAARKDRSGGKYSESAFRRLPRDQQRELVQKYWVDDAKGFDASEMFQFSYSHFSKICAELGFQKKQILIDLRQQREEKRKAASEAEDVDEQKKDVEKIYIDRNYREHPVRRKMTLEASTFALIDEFLGENLTKLERSKIVEKIITDAVMDALKKKKEGKLQVAYSAVGEKVIFGKQERVLREKDSSGSPE